LVQFEHETVDANSSENEFLMKGENRNMKKIIVAFFGLFLLHSVSAQRNFTLHQHQHTAQSIHLNPAFRPNARFYGNIGSGMHSFGINHSGFTLNQLLVQRDFDDSLEFRPADAINAMARINHINLDFNNELIGFGLRLGKTYFSLTATNRMQFSLIYPRDLFRFVFEGNGASLLGQRADLDGLGLKFNSYMEYALGANRTFLDDKLTIGVRFKLISGIANIHTAKSQLGIYTDSTTFDITIDGAMHAYSSGLNSYQVSDFRSLGFKYLTRFPNMGMGLDLGATFRLNDMLDFSASVIDLGFINWKEGNKNYISNDVNYTFEGVDINQFLADSSDFVQNFTDTLRGIFNASENDDAYRTSLNTRFYLGARFKVADILHLTGLWFNEFILGNYRPGLSVGATLKLKEILSISANYSLYGRSLGNVGLGFNMRLGSVQFFAMTDNILGVLNFSASKNWHFNVGMAFYIGKPDNKNKSE
jgi:hypothetical protein